MIMKNKQILKKLSLLPTISILCGSFLLSACSDQVAAVLEGQEDVVIFNKMAQQLNMTLKGNFFGWGVGGASKMKAFLMLFKDLGYKKIVAVLDGDKADDAEKLRAEFSAYKIITLKEDDIRDKKAREIQAKFGIADEKGNYKEEDKEYIIGLINEINSAL